LQPQAPVFKGDVIATGPSGEAQVQLLDQTRLVVGPNSRLEIDSFVYSGNGTAQQVSLNAVRGAFRFITGHSQKTAYTIRTPTATIGVRGTEFDFNVDSAGGMEMALYSGWAQICDPQRRRRCVEVWGACSVAVAPPGQGARRITEIDDRTKQLEEFRYLARQANLRQEFRVDTSSCGVRRAERPNGGTVPPITNVNLPQNPEEPPVEPVDNGGNKGWGNGGDSSAEGPNEQNNPGQGHAYGRTK
jgi:hypothetical protein